MTVGAGLSFLDVAIVVGSLAAVVALGLFVSRRQRDSAHDYFLASGRLPWWIIGSAFVSTSVSSEQIVGTMGAVYREGLAIANWEWWCLPTYLLTITFFVPIYLRNRITTVPELLRRRFGPRVADIYGVVMLLAYVSVFLVAVVYSGSLVFAELTGLPFAVVLVVLVLLVALYTSKGGFMAVMWTDALQCVLLLGGGIILFFVALGEIPGGWAELQRAQSARLHLYRPADDPSAPFLGLVVASFGVFLFYQATNQVMVQRVLAARTPWDGAMGIIFAGFISLARPLATCLLGLVVYQWTEHLGRAPTLQNPDLAFPFALGVFGSSNGLRGIVLAGFIAAVMSTMSALANSTATLFAYDVYRRWIRPDADDRAMVRAGRRASWAALVLAAALCPVVAEMGGAFLYFQTGVTYVATPFIAVFILGLFSRGITETGVVVGIVCGLGLQIAMAVTVALAGWRIHWLYIAAVAEIVTMLIVVIVSRFGTPPAADRIESLIWKPSVLALYRDGITPRWYRSLPLWMGLYAVGWFIIYGVFW